MKQNIGNCQHKYTNSIHRQSYTPNPVGAHKCVLFEPRVRKRVPWRKKLCDSVLTTFLLCLPWFWKAKFLCDRACLWPILYGTGCMMYRVIPQTPVISLVKYPRGQAYSCTCWVSLEDLILHLESSLLRFISTLLHRCTTHFDRFHKFTWLEIPQHWS